MKKIVWGIRDEEELDDEKMLPRKREGNRERDCRREKSLK